MLHKQTSLHGANYCMHTHVFDHLIVFLFCVFFKTDKNVHSCNIERSNPLVLYMLIFCKALVLVFDFIFVDMIKKKKDV